MLGVTAYAVLVFIINIVIGLVLLLGVIQQAKSSFGISSVVSWVFFAVSLAFFASGGFVNFYSKLGLSISPVAYLVIAIYSMLAASDISKLNIRKAMRKAILFSIIMIVFLIIDLIWVKDAAFVALFSIGWAYVITLIFGIKNRNIE